MTDSINLLPETCFFTLCPVDVTVNLLVTHQFDIVGTEIVAHRVTTNAAPTDIHYDGASPASETEEIDVPCDANVGDDINYDLSEFNYEPDVSVTGDIGIEFVIDGPLFLDASPVLDLVEDFPVFDGTVPMSDDTAHVFLGDTLLDNQPPQISAVLQSGTFVEGSDVTFNAVATDNCADDLNYLWSWSDHGTAFGPRPSQFR